MDERKKLSILCIHNPPVLSVAIFIRERAVSFGSSSLNLHASGGENI